MVLYAQSTTKNHIRAEGDFHKEMCSPKVGWSVSWCFEPTQPQRITSGLTVQRTNKAEIRLEKQGEKAKNCRENLWNETIERATKTETGTTTD